jgi:hypothetical protein
VIIPITDLVERHRIDLGTVLGAHLGEIDAQLVGFVRMETALTGHGWGDAFYVRAGEVAPGVELRSWTA